MDAFTSSVIILVAIVFIVLWVIMVYNRLITNKNLVQEGWSGIDIQLKRRSDLIPNLMETVKGYMVHEREVLQNVTELRAKCRTAQGLPERAQAEGLLSAGLSKIFALSENYPDLKASANFMQLQKDLKEIEEQIQLSRRYYNGAARYFNIMIESFPTNLIANFFHFAKVSYFELENPADKEVPKVVF
jgi:LemA protein